MAAAQAAQPAPILDVYRVREDFPMLKQSIKGMPLVYLDSAASGQKPRVMIERLRQFYANEYAKTQENHFFSQQATQMFEDVRTKTAAFINAADPKEIVFVRNCSEGVNLVALAFERAFLKAGDEIVITAMEHHSNIVPWQLACQRTGAVLKVAPLTLTGEIDLPQLEALLSERTKMVSLVHSSQVLGTINPVKKIVQMARKWGIPVLVDGPQTAPHMPIDMQELGCDFYVFTGHKMGSPTGVGVLYARKEWLEKMPPHQGGETMAQQVTFSKTTYADLPYKFQAGTPAIAEIIGFGTVIDYMNGLGMQKVADFEQQLLAYAQAQLAPLDRVHILGSASEKEPLVSLVFDGADVKKAEQFLNEQHGIAVRAGQLSSQPLFELLGQPGALRASFGFYNTFEEIDAFVEGIGAFLKKNG
jgi:cysteine desulfurase/selenocysteine lyase